MGLQKLCLRWTFSPGGWSTIRKVGGQFGVKAKEKEENGEFMAKTKTKMMDVIPEV
jgi:hypothetical protein